MPSSHQELNRDFVNTGQLFLLSSYLFSFLSFAQTVAWSLLQVPCKALGQALLGERLKPGPQCGGRGDCGVKVGDEKHCLNGLACIRNLMETAPS